MLNTILYLIVGGIVISGFILRYRTINNKSFNLNFTITVFIFSSLAIGICITNTSKAIQIKDEIFSNTFAALITLITLILTPSFINIIKGTKFTESFKPNIYYMISFILLTSILSLALYINEEYVNLIVLVMFFFAIGALHGILGPIISSINLALIINHFSNNEIHNISISSIFDILSLFGPSSEIFKWLILALSTFLGAHSALNYSWIKDKIFHQHEYKTRHLSKQFLYERFINHITQSTCSIYRRFTVDKELG